MNKIYTIKELPREYFGGTYEIFCFETLQGVTPLALHIGSSVYDIITITDLDKLNGCFEGEYFHHDKESYGLFVEFLKSITLKPDARFPVYFDIVYTQEQFFVDMRLV